MSKDCSIYKQNCLIEHVQLFKYPSINPTLEICRVKYVLYYNNSTDETSVILTLITLHEICIAYIYIYITL